MAFKKPVAKVPVPDSPDKLFRDLPRRKHPSLYDHQGQILRTYVAHALNESDVALQLPTGSGKTLVGLLLAEWRRRKFNEKIVYLCPTRQLVNQVAAEGITKYGISVEAFTGSVRDYAPSAKTAYRDGAKVAVTTYSSLFNTNPFFKKPDLIILDDSHAAENYIANQWTVCIDREENAHLYKAITSVLRAKLQGASYRRLKEGIKNIDDIAWVDKFPTGDLCELAQELQSVISEYLGNDGSQRWAWSMLNNNIEACQLYLSCSEIIIRPLIPPTWTHSPFSNAKQRIFMSATLGEGGDLERLTGRARIKRLPIPEGWDKQGIGRRFFIFPERSLDEDEVVKLRRELMVSSGRSLVLTPSNSSADKIIEDIEQEVGFNVFNASDLERDKSTFLKEDKAVAVIANRYDGIDFPNDECRLLCVEGLPRAVNAQERFLMTRMGAGLLFNERVQTRVLQAIGRCTRGLNDFSTIIVTGDELPSYLTDLQRRKYFHPELQAEIEFGIEQSNEVTADDIIDNVRIFLRHGDEWEAVNEHILELRSESDQSKFPAMNDLSEAVKHEISWQEAMWAKDYAKAYDSAREVLGTLNDPELRGYRALWHYLAGSTASLTEAKGLANLNQQAREQFRRAKDAAMGIPWLVQLAYQGSDVPNKAEITRALCMTQVEQLEVYLQQLGTVHNRSFSSKEKEIRDGLSDPNSFEQAQVLLGNHLGFIGGKKECDASPDPWWIVGDKIIVFEDHANADPVTAVIDATKARQALSHPNWIRENVPGVSDDSIIQSVLVSPAGKAKAGAMPHLGDVSFWKLDEFREWAEAAIVTIRDLRRNFREPGDLAWRAEAAQKISDAQISISDLMEWLDTQRASTVLEKVY